jgi:hypothetical protein
MMNSELNLYFLSWWRIHRKTSLEFSPNLDIMACDVKVKGAELRYLMSDMRG